MMLLYLWDISELCIFIFSDTEANGLASGDSQNSPLHRHKRTSDKREVLCFQAGCRAWNYCGLPPASDCRWEKWNVKAGVLPMWPMITTYKCPFMNFRKGTGLLKQSPPWSFLFLLWPPSGLPSTQQPEGLLHSCESDSLPNPLQSPRVAPTSLRGKANILSTPYKPLPDLAPSLTSFCELALSIILKTPGLECSKLSTRGFPCTAAPTCILISLSLRF